MWPGIEEYDELIGDGWIGAIAAVDNFRGEFEASLKTYAYIRVRGAMIDGIRSRHGRVYVDDRLGSPRTRFKHVHLDSPVGGQESFGAYGAGRETILADILPDDEDAMTRALDILIVQEAMPLLPDREAEILHRYYWLGHTLMAIANDEGVTESRVSQIIAAAKHKMYRVLTADGTQEF